MTSLLRRIADRIRRRTEDREEWDDWPMCPDCWMRFPAQSLLEAHWNREPDCDAREDA